MTLVSHSPTTPASISLICSSRRWVPSISDAADFTGNGTWATFNITETFTAKALIEPIVGLKIDLNARYSTTDQQRTDFVFNSKTWGGVFDMTIVTIGSAFENSNAGNGYRSKSFDAFLNNRKIIRNRLENAYGNVKYPNAGFIPQEFRGQDFDPANGTLNLNSIDVLIPSFIAAYTGKDPNKTGMTAFPSLKSLLPNWKLTYDGFMQLDFISQNFKNFVVSHEYRSRYAVGSYTSDPTWIRANDDFGFIQDRITNNPMPSSPYEILTVSITEAFNPLIGVNATFLNNMSLRMELKNTRNVNLNLAGPQIVESKSDNYVIGVGYKLTEFNKVLKMKGSGGSGFSNDLTISADISYQRIMSLIRNIQNGSTQGTSGDAQTTIKISADYNLSRMLTIQAFFDRAVSKPLILNAFPYSKSSGGINLKFKLSR